VHNKTTDGHMDEEQNLFFRLLDMTRKLSAVAETFPPSIMPPPIPSLFPLYNGQSEMHPDRRTL
jgi:hypothetical protein